MEIDNGSDVQTSIEKDYCNTDFESTSEIVEEDDDEQVVPEDGSDLETSALSRLCTLTDIEVTLQPSDIDEDRLVAMFIDGGCGCSKWKGKDCVLQFSASHVQECRSQCQQISRLELDMLLIGQLLAFGDISSGVSTESRHSPSPRVRIHYSYHHKGKSICLKTFLFLHGIGIKRLKNIAKSYHDHGILPRVHGNSKRLPHNTLNLQSVQHVISFLVNYTEENGLLLPGRLPGYRKSDVKLLPSSTSKMGIWKLYQNAANACTDTHVVAYSTFCHLWRTLLPSVILMRPMADLCWQCQQNSQTVLRTANSPEAEKSSVLQNALEHLRVVTMERSYYRSITKECRESIRSHFVVNGIFQPPPLSGKIPENSDNIKVHYSFDYAQMVRVLEYLKKLNK